MRVYSYEVKHFAPPEFVCRCGRCGTDPRAAAPLVIALDMLRRAWAAPIIITSGYRCPEHNAAVGGAAKSRHMAGIAADFRPREPELMPALQSLVGSMYGGLYGWELRMYPRYIHLAIPRGEWPIWTGGVIHGGF